MNLTPEQLELLLQLLGALAIGFLFGYILSKAFAREQYDLELEDFSALLDVRDREIESAAAKYGQLKQHLAVQANELKQTKEKMEDLQVITNKLENSSKLINDEKIELESLLLKKDMQISELNEEAGFSQNELKEMQNLIDDYKVANSTNNEKLLAAQKEIDQNAELTHVVAKKSEEQTEKVKTLEAQKSVLSSKIDLLTKTINEKENIISEFEKRTLEKEPLVEENRALKARVESLSKSLEARKNIVVEPDNSKMDALQEKYNNLQKSYGITKKEVEQKEVNIITLQKSFDDAKKEIAKKEADIANLQRDKNDKGAQTQQNSSIESLNDEILHIKAELLRKDKKLKLAEEKLQLSQIKRNVLNDKDSSYLAESEGSKEQRGFIKFVKDTFGSNDKNK
jgi:chromosome segregation ATPase